MLSELNNNAAGNYLIIPIAFLVSVPSTRFGIDRTTRSHEQRVFRVQRL